MDKKFLKLERKDIFAVYYRCNKTLYYNIKFNGKTKITLLR